MPHLNSPWNQGHVCLQCLAGQFKLLRKPSTAASASLRPHARQALHSSASRRQQFSGQPQSGAVHLTNRRLLALHGQDAAHFLQGITTNNVPTSAAASALSGAQRAARAASPDSLPLHTQPRPAGFYSAFLNAQGRILYDVFVYPASHSPAYRSRLPDAVKRKHGESEPAFLVEVDAAHVDSLHKHLTRYKLRAKLDVWALEHDEWGVWSTWSNTAASPPNNTEYGINAPDSRAPDLGHRHVWPLADMPKGLDEHPLSTYTLRRHLHGVPEGQASGEIPYAASLPHECNLDLMGGVDFRKGCYVGQELTIRTQHKGVVRKRVLPVRLYAPGAPPTSLDDHMSGDQGLVARVAAWGGDGADIVPLGRRGRPAGRWLAGAGDVGLGMCRVEMMTDLVVEAGEAGVRWKEGDEFALRRRKGDGDEGKDAQAEDKEQIAVKAFVPQWIRDGIKVRKPAMQV